MPHTARNKTRKRRLRLMIAAGAVLLLALTLLLVLRPFGQNAVTETGMASDGAVAAMPTPEEPDGTSRPDGSSSPEGPESTSSPEGAFVDGAFPDGAAPDGAEARSLYEAVLDCDPEAGVVEGQLRLTYRNAGPETLYQVVLRLWPNAMAQGSLTVHSVSMEGKAVYHTLTDNGSVLSVPLNRDLVPGGSATLYMRYTLNVPEQENRFGRSSTGLLLGNALPVAAALEAGQWRLDSYVNAGDSFVSDIADYKVVIRCPQTYIPAASGGLYEAKLGEDGVYEAYYIAPNVRDFAVALVNKCFTAVSSSAHGVPVYGYATFKDRAQYLADTAAGALSYFETQIGPYPYAEFSAVGGTLPGGMEYPGLIMVESDVLAGSRRAMGEVYIAHETAHQWFYAVLGTDQVREPWVDEALVEFLGFDYIRSVHGEAYSTQLAEVSFAGMDAVPPSLPLNAPLADFAAAEKSSEYFNAVYARGYQLYDELYRELGEEVFYAALRDIYARRMFQRITGAELIEAFSQAAGRDMEPVFDAYMTPPGVG